MKCAKIILDGLGSYIVPLFTLKDILDSEFDGVEEFAEVGDRLTVEIVEMSEEDYENLPEFMGW